MASEIRHNERMRLPIFLLLLYVGAALAACGDNIVDVGEQCDLGGSNGAVGSCCTSACTFRAAASVCRVAAGPCDQVEMCTGSSALCPSDAYQPSSTVCRALQGPCDTPEYCTGLSVACPANLYLTNSTVCRSSAGPCDVQEVCTGSSPLCPTNAYRSNTFVCRAQQGLCDVSEYCSGVTAECPPDALVIEGAVCRAAAGACDQVEVCDGLAAQCPVDLVKAVNTTCRSAIGDCDQVEVCDGASAVCPVDVFVGEGVVCRDATGACDLTERCTGINPFCPRDAFKAAGTVCALSDGPCEHNASCSGVGGTCPAKERRSGSYACRPSVGACDPAETCSMTVDATCAADVLSDSSTVCREAGGDCDIEETCTGTDAECPVDAFFNSSVVCRAQAAACDLEETCPGDAPHCPPDAYEPAGVLCAIGLNDCSVSTFCNGHSVDCPENALPDGSPCTVDGNLCYIDECLVGICVRGREKFFFDGNACNGIETCNPIDGTKAYAQPPVCDDGNSCTRDYCSSSIQSCTSTQLPQVGAPCGKTLGACVAGAYACDGSGPTPSYTCTSSIDPVEEVCGDAIDNDCDGEVDEYCTPAPCLTDANCLVDLPLSTCETATCNGTHCVVTRLPINSSCNDGLSCTHNDQCTSLGTCEGTPVVCNDDNECTYDTCVEPYGSCLFDPTDFRDNPCTPTDGFVPYGTCDMFGVCVANFNIECEDLYRDNCYTYTYNASTGLCDLGTRVGACSDSNACTLNDMCLDGLCIGHERDCDDGLWCTTDSCNGGTGECVHSLIPNACYIDGVCYGEEEVSSLCPCHVCRPPTSQVEWTFADSSFQCDDQDPCTVNDLCDDFNRVCAGVPLDCSYNDTECVQGECDRGQCVFRHVNEDGPCDDGLASTYDDECIRGVCVGIPINFFVYSNASGCSIPVFDELAGLTFVDAADYTACNVGSDLCEEVYVCLSGQCVSTGPRECPVPASPCLQAACAPGYGCTTAPLTGETCDDLNVCTIGDACGVHGECVPGAITLDCDDHDPCTDDLCLADIGCVHIPIASCTACAYTEDCSPQLCHHAFCIGGQCQYFAREAGTSCSDGDVCNGREVCAGNGVCVSEGPLFCDDHNPCTDDHCDPMSGCFHVVNTTNTCDDGNACTVSDQCALDGQCVGDPYACPESTECLAQQCVVISGNPTCVQIPQNEGVWCNANDACIHSSVCTPFGTCEGQLNACPLPGECVLSISCAGGDCVSVYEAPGTLCRTHDLCNEHMCDGTGGCILTQVLVNCTTSQPLCRTDGFCVPQTGECVYNFAPDETLCDDGSACTPLDICIDGDCVGVDGVVCTSSDQCHGQGTCDPLTGLCDDPPLPNYTPCIDNNICMTSSVCMLGTCVSNDPIQCPQSDNQCLVSRCDPAQGCLFDFVADSTPCDDGNACTLGETCTEGVCGGGAPANCTNEGVCGISYCMPSQGCMAPLADDCHACTKNKDCPYIPCKNGTCQNGVCAYAAQDEAVSGCSDGERQNGHEYCFAGTCILGTVPVCDDNNPCTRDTFNKNTGQCEYAVQELTVCESDDLCSVTAMCDLGGHCVVVDRLQCDDIDDCKVSLGCNAGTGVCDYAARPDGSPCVDDDPCSAESSCYNGVCNAVRPLICGGDCQCKEAGVCDALTGECKEQASCQRRVCTDGNPCTVGDLCDRGDECAMGPYTACSTENQCQVATCMEDGSCLIVDASDHTPCTLNAPTGVCSGRDACIAGVCQRLYAAGEVCRAKAPGGCDLTERCIDGEDHCPNDEREANGTACPSTLFCYENTCQQGVCVPDVPRDCSVFDDQCTVGVCDEELGSCVAHNIADDTQCVSGEENQCTPLSTCKSGVCTPYYANELTLCDDGDVCTRDSFCSGYDGTCVMGVPLDCTHLDSACGTGFCDTLSGLCEAQSINEGQPCDADGDACTPNDACHLGFCVADAPLDCSYLNSSCQYGMCDAGVCTTVVTGPACDPENCVGGCTVPFQWWSLHTSRCKSHSKRFTWPDDLENARICGQSYYYWSQKRARNAWRLLAQQWLAATLNEANGACVPAEIAPAMSDAYNLLLGCNMTVNVTGPPGRPYRQLASTLNAYNTGSKGPGTCLRPSCAQQANTGGYFACLFPQLQARDLDDDISPMDCQNGMWDYVSDLCDCELGWAGATCSECGVPDVEDYTFLCVPTVDAYILRSISDSNIPLYINDNVDELHHTLQILEHRTRYPGDGVLDCACNVISSARDVVTYGDISVYVTEIERNYQDCEQLFQVMVVDQSLTCDPNATEIIIQPDTPNCTAPEDWAFICDCCGPEDDDCVCPHNDWQCLREHLKTYNWRLHLFEMLDIIFIASVGFLFLLVLTWWCRRPSVPKQAKWNRLADQFETFKAAPINFSLKPWTTKKTRRE